MTRPGGEGESVGRYGDGWRPPVRNDLRVVIGERSCGPAPPSTSAGTSVSIRAIHPRTGLKFSLASSRPVPPSPISSAHIPPRERRVQASRQSLTRRSSRTGRDCPQLCLFVGPYPIYQIGARRLYSYAVWYGRCIVYLVRFTRECLERQWRVMNR